MRMLTRSIHRPGLLSVRAARSSTTSLALAQLAVALLAVVSGAVLGCTGDTATNVQTIPVGSNPNVFWALRLNQHAINMALTSPSNTLQLTATPVTAAGTPLVGAGSATFTAKDSTVSVSASGVVTAHYQTSLTQVIASLQVKGVTLADTAFIQVKATAPAALSTFSMQPGPGTGDSAKVTIDSEHVYWPVTATNGAGTVCDSTGCPLLIAYASSNPARAHLGGIAGNGGVGPRIVQFPENGNFQFNTTGHVYLIAETWAYGDSLRDSVDFTVGLQLNIVNILTEPSSGAPVSFSVTPKVVVGVGATLNFWNKVPTPLDIVFNDTTGIEADSVRTPIQTQFFGPLPPTGTGNIPAFGGDTVCNEDSLVANGVDCSIPAFYQLKWIWLPQDFTARRFTVPGVYQYRSLLGRSATYTIVVHNDR